MTDTTVRPGPFAAKAPGPVATGERDARFDNQPPLAERVLLEFEEDLNAPGPMGEPSIKARVAELIASAQKAPATCDNNDMAGSMGDLCKLARNVELRIEEARKRRSDPLREATTRLKATADATFAPLAAEVAKLRDRVDAWIRAEDARVRRERAAAQAEADRLRAEARKHESLPGEIVVDIAPKKVEAPQAKGGLGSSVSARKVWKFEREVPIAKLPKAVLENQKVIDAVDSVLGQMVRNGTREIKGVRIYEDVGTTIR